jgi:DNA polymerase III alpha subunit (gram-positive type)
MRRILDEILVLDIETTALKPSNGTIVEIGVVKLNLNTAEINDVFHTLVNDEFTEEMDNAWIFQNSDLTPEMVRKEGKPIAEFKLKLQALFDEHFVMAYNQSFDFKFLEAAGFELPNTLRDIMRDLMYVIKIPRGLGYKWPSVQEALTYYKIDEIELHRGLSDAEQEAKIIYLAHYNGDFNINSAKHRAETKNEQELRLLSKLESYNNLLKEIPFIPGEAFEGIMNKIHVRKDNVMKRLGL